MKINGIDIKIYQAKQWNVEPAFATITNSSEWTTGSISPLMMNTEAGMKKIKVSVIVRGKERQVIWKNASALIAALSKPSEIELDGFDNAFYMVITNASQAELALQRFHKATLELVGYEHGAEVVQNYTQRQITINNAGNMTTPAVLEITPLIGKVSLTISGIVRDKYTLADKPVTISKLTQNKKIILDGEKELVTEAGANKFPDVDMWDFPSLIPGTNTIQLSQPDIEVTVKYKPRYI